MSSILFHIVDLYSTFSINGFKLLAAHIFLLKVD